MKERALRHLGNRPLAMAWLAWVSGAMTEKLNDVRDQHEAQAKAREEAEAATNGSFRTTSSTPKNRNGEKAG